jgi:hypothetical protein
VVRALLEDVVDDALNRLETGGDAAFLRVEKAGEGFVEEMRIVRRGEVSYSVEENLKMPVR